MCFSFTFVFGMKNHDSQGGHLWASGVVEMGWLGAGAAFPRTAAEPGLLPPPWRLRPLLLRCKSAMDSLPTVAHHRACHLRMHAQLKLF